MPALVQQVTTSNGNLAALFHYVRDPRQATAGWTLVYGVLGAELRPVGAWVTGNDNDGIGFTAVSDVWPAAVVLALLVCTGLLAWWRGRRDAARLSAVAAVSVVLAVIATSKLTGDVAFYLTRWWWAVAAIANLAVVWALISVFDSRRLRHVVTGLALLGIVVAGVMSVGDLPASFAQSDMVEAVGRLNGPTAEALARQTRYLVQPFDTSQLGFVSKGLFVSLEATRLPGLRASRYRLGHRVRQLASSDARSGRCAAVGRRHRRARLAAAAQRPPGGRLRSTVTSGARPVDRTRGEDPERDGPSSASPFLRVHEIQQGRRRGRGSVGGRDRRAPGPPEPGRRIFRVPVARALTPAIALPEDGREPLHAQPGSTSIPPRRSGIMCSS